MKDNLFDAVLHAEFEYENRLCKWALPGQRIAHKSTENSEISIQKAVLWRFQAEIQMKMNFIFDFPTFSSVYNMQLAAQAKFSG